MVRRRAPAREPPCRVLEVENDGGIEEVGSRTRRVEAGTRPNIKSSPVHALFPNAETRFHTFLKVSVPRLSTAPVFAFAVTSFCTSSLITTVVATDLPPTTPTPSCSPTISTVMSFTRSSIPGALAFCEMVVGWITLAFEVACPSVLLVDSSDDRPPSPSPSSPSVTLLARLKLGVAGIDASLSSSSSSSGIDDGSELADVLTDEKPEEDAADEGLDGDEEPCMNGAEGVGRGKVGSEAVAVASVDIDKAVASSMRDAVSLLILSLSLPLSFSLSLPSNPLKLPLKLTTLRLFPFSTSLALTGITTPSVFSPIREKRGGAACVSQLSSGSREVLGRWPWKTEFELLLLLCCCGPRCGWCEMGRGCVTGAVERRCKLRLLVSDALDDEACDSEIETETEDGAVDGLRLRLRTDFGAGLNVCAWNELGGDGFADAFEADGMNDGRAHTGTLGTPTMLPRFDVDADDAERVGTAVGSPADADVEFERRGMGREGRAESRLRPSDRRRLGLCLEGGGGVTGSSSSCDSLRFSEEGVALRLPLANTS